MHKKQSSLHVLTMTTRKLPLTLLFMAVIISTISFLPVQEAKASTELAYDNGSQQGSYTAGYGAVRFSLPSGASGAKLLAVRYYPVDPEGANPSGDVTVYITGADHVTLLASPLTTTPTSYNAFNSLDVSSLNIVVSGDFFVAIFVPQAIQQWIASDSGPGAGRSYGGASLAALDPGFYASFSVNIMIRAVIDPLNSPVGGVVMPTSKLEVVAPYAALAGLLVAVSAVVVVKRRRD